jgi:serine/threonine protein kinase
MSSKSLLYTRDGKIVPLNSLHGKKPFFRKEAVNEREITIATLLRKNPHPNIVTFYTISPKRRYIDMEMLDTKKTIPKKKLISTLSSVKDHLQSLGIMYIDWKPDQVGLTPDGTIKLFDFDVSGTIDTKTKKWILPPPTIMWSYRQADARGLTDPYEIDDYAFTLLYPPSDFKEA